MIPTLSLLLLLHLFFPQNLFNKCDQTKHSFDTKTIITEDYELIISSKQQGLLILFPCFPCNAKHTKSEFNIIETAQDKGISLFLMNFNQHLYITQKETNDLYTILSSAINQNQLKVDNIYIGGFSSGGNVALLLSNYLIKTNKKIQPKGVFIVDSPVDLLGLYENANRIINQSQSEVAVQEAEWIINFFNLDFGSPDTSLDKYKKYAPYILKNGSIDNISELKQIKLSMFTEPDTNWWYKNRQIDYEYTNAYYIRKLSEELEKKGWEKAEHITSENRGYRSNGERHPHSWSIVDEKKLADWIIKD